VGGKEGYVKSITSQVKATLQPGWWEKTRVKRRDPGTAEREREYDNRRTTGEIQSWVAKLNKQVNLDCQKVPASTAGQRQGRSTHFFARTGNKLGKCYENAMKKRDIIDGKEAT